MNVVPPCLLCRGPAPWTCANCGRGPYCLRHLAGDDCKACSDEHDCHAEAA